MGARKWMIPAIILIVLAVAAFLLLHDWEPPDIPAARGGPHLGTPVPMPEPESEPEPEPEPTPGEPPEYGLHQQE